MSSATSATAGECFSQTAITRSVAARRAKQSRPSPIVCRRFTPGAVAAGSLFLLDSSTTHRAHGWLSGGRDRTAVGGSP
jgi:hypothetical protein